VLATTRTRAQVQGSVGSIIRNRENLYEGNLKAYFRIVFYAKNVNRPYHNFQHMLFVMVMCYLACKYYGRRLSPRQMRNLLIAAIFHDFNHLDEPENDDLNIARAIRGLRKHILPEDAPYLDEIEEIIESTQYPHRKTAEPLSLSCQIIRDADLMQALGISWMQSSLFGLAAEWGIPSIDMLKLGIKFHQNLHFKTQWANRLFPRRKTLAKAEEGEDILAILTEAP
jgi:hypothetical protein